MIDGVSGRQLTYRQLADSVGRVATALRRHGVKQGDVFAIFSPNLPEYPIAFHAVASLGAINTTLNSLYTPRELADQLKDSGARFLLTVPAFMDRATEAIKGLPIEEVFVFGEAQGATPFADLMSQPAEAFTVDIDPANDLVALPYSSGTTGVAKGVMLTHRNLVANVLQAERSIHLREPSGRGPNGTGIARSRLRGAVQQIGQRRRLSLPRDVHHLEGMRTQCQIQLFPRQRIPACLPRWQPVLPAGTQH